MWNLGSLLGWSSSEESPSPDSDKPALKRTTSDAGSKASDDDAFLEKLTISAQSERKSIEGPQSPDLSSPNARNQADKVKVSELKFVPGLIPATTLMQLSANVRTNCWAEPDALAFKVRGANYLDDKIKITQPAAYSLLGVDLWKCEALPEHIAARKDGFVSQMRNNALKLNEKPPFVFLVNFLLPWGAFVCYFTSGTAAPTIGHAAFDKTILAFINGDDDYRNQRWKFIPRMIEGNWAVRKAIGENTPVIVSKRITHKYFKGEGYFEVDCDITSSKVARSILGLVQNYVSKIVLDMVVLVEGQTGDELPEKILGGVRFVKLDPENAPKLPVPTLMKQSATAKEGGGMSRVDSSSDLAD